MCASLCPKNRDSLNVDSIKTRIETPETIGKSWKYHGLNVDSIKTRIETILLLPML